MNNYEVSYGKKVLIIIKDKEILNVIYCMYGLKEEDDWTTIRGDLDLNIYLEDNIWKWCLYPIKDGNTDINTVIARGNLILS